MAVSQQTELFAHPALLYHGDDEYLKGLVSFIEEGLSLGDPVAVAVPGDRLGLVAAALGEAAERVRMIDMAEAGRNPGRIIPGVLCAFADQHPGKHVRIIGEPVWSSRTDEEYPACVQHEALINLSFTGRDVTILCPYDAETLGPRALADACATHPVVWESDRRSVSENYAPERVVARYNRPLSAPPDACGRRVDAITDLAAARRFVTAHAGRLGLSADRIDDLVLVANELVTNSLTHTCGGCELVIWREGDDVVCEVRDGGYIGDPLAGRRRSAPKQYGGRGLLLVNELADLVRTYTTPSGTTIQAHWRVC